MASERTSTAGSPRPWRSWRWCFSVRACSSAVIVRCRANERGCRQASSPVSSATARTSRSVTLASTRRPTSAGRASNRRCQSADRDRAATRSTQRRSVSGAVAGSGAITSRSSSSRSIGRACSVLWMRGVGALGRTRRRAAAGSRARSRSTRPGSNERSMKSCRRSTPPLACGSRGAQKCQPTASCPQKRGERLGRAPAAGVQAGLAVPDQRLRQRAERPQAAPDAEQQLRRLLGEDQRAGAGARVAQARDDDPALAGLAMADRDLALGSHRSNWQISPGR